MTTGDFPTPYLYLAGFAMVSGTVVFAEPAPYDLAIILLLIAGFALRRLRFNAQHRLPAALLGGFIAVQAMSLTHVPDLGVALRYASIDAYLAVAWLFFVSITTAHGRPAMRVLLGGYTLGGIAVALASAAAFLGLLPDPALLLKYGRAQGLFKDPNVFGPYLVPVLLYGLARLERQRPLTRGFAVFLVVCAISALGLLLSFSRAAWLNCAVTLLCFLGIRFVSGMRWRRVSGRLLICAALLVVVAGGVVLFALAGNSSTARMLAMRLGNNGLQNYDAVRFYTHDRAIQSVIDEPLGIGPGQSEIVFDYATHNMYFRVLTEAGVPGFALLFGFVLLSFVRSLRGALISGDPDARELFAVVSACLVGIFVNGLVIDTFHWRHFWFLLGLAWWVPRKVGDPGDVEA